LSFHESASPKGWYRIGKRILAALSMSCCISWDIGVCHVGYSIPHFSSIRNGFRYGFPPQTRKTGIKFAGIKVPIHRKSVRDRILRQLNYLLLDRRSLVRLWLHRAHHRSSVILPILKKHKVPLEFIYLAAIESSYDSRSLSSAGAYGYWQFMKATAKKGPSTGKQYDWSMEMNNWKDERANLIVSTRGAARYLAWLNRVKKVSMSGKQDRSGFQDWFLTAAAYNAGPARVSGRMRDYGTGNYWDLPLPVETEKYVPRWIALGLIGRYRKFYGLNIDPSEKISFDRVRKVVLRKNLTFTALAGLVGSTPRAVADLNSEIKPEKAVFPAKYRGRRISHTIYVPKGKGKTLISKLRAKGYVK